MKMNISLVSCRKVRRGSRLLGAAGPAVVVLGGWRRVGVAPEEFHGHGEDDGRVLLGGDRVEGLEVAELERGGRAGDHLGGFLQGARRSLFTCNAIRRRQLRVLCLMSRELLHFLTLGGDDFGARFSRRLGFGRHGTLQLEG